jgi:hypothetical protein
LALVAVVAVPAFPSKSPLKIVEETSVGVIVVVELPLLKYNPFGEVTAKYPVTTGLVTY